MILLTKYSQQIRQKLCVNTILLVWNLLKTPGLFQSFVPKSGFLQKKSRA